MRIIVTGDRNWYAPELAEAVVTRLLARYGMGVVIVHGATSGIDRSFAEVCDDLGVEQESHPAHREDLDHPDAVIRRKGGRDFDAMAGPIRNQQMVDAGAGMCIAFHRAIGASKGSKGCCRRAMAAGIPAYLIDSERGMPKRLVEGDERLG